MSEKIYVFWHLCGMNNWREVADDQYRTMESSGLLDRSEQVNLTFLGKDKRDFGWLEKKSNKINVNQYSSDLRQYERMCLNGLRRWSEQNDGLIIYIHGKGVSRKNNKNVWEWRKMLEYFIVESHERCAEEMKNLDTLGGNACVVRRNLGDLERPGHGMHYSGNFWWSRASYIRSLPSIREDVRLDINGNYYKQCEYWLLSNFPKMRCGVVFKTDRPHYYKSPPERNFRNKWL